MTFGTHFIINSFFFEIKVIDGLVSSASQVSFLIYNFFLFYYTFHKINYSWLFYTQLKYQVPRFSPILDFFLKVQDYKEVKFSGRDISSLTAKGLKRI